MPSNKEKKSRKAVRATRTRARQTEAIGAPMQAAEEPKLTHKDIPEKYRFTDDYLNWLQNSHGRTTAREIDETTDRIFDSVLSKLGWSRDEQGNLEPDGSKAA